MTYKNKIDKRASELVESDIKQLKIDHNQAKRIAALRKKDSTNIYYFFKSATDYAFARWLHQFKLIKKNVNNLFQEFRIKVLLNDHFNFYNFENWMTKMHEVSYDISDDEWIKNALINETQYENVKSIELFFFYRNVIRALKFLIDHQSFIDNMTYEFVRKYNDNERKIFSEMHIENWW